jgi:hypothetical protein
MIRKLALTLFLLIVAVVVAILAIAGTRPPTYHVERSATMSAPPAVVHLILNDLHKFPQWSPWQKLDPNMKITIAGSGIGPGSSYSWVGNDKVGEGRMTITSVSPPNEVAMKLEFIKPFQSTCDVHFRVQPEGAGSKVTWAMDGNNNMMSKVMGLFVSMDSMMGKDFDNGLANLKQVSESNAQTMSSAPPGTASAAAPGGQ